MTRSRTLVATLLVLIVALAVGLRQVEKPAPALSPSPAAPRFAVIPQPVSLRAGQGQFQITQATPILCDAELVAQAHQLSDLLASATGFGLTVRGTGTQTPYIALRLRTALSEKLGSEGYTLEASPRSVTVTAATPVGIYYGIQTLRQLLPTEIFASSPQSVTWQIPAVSILDFPRFSWRGAHLDVSRHFMPKAFILKFLDLMALHKLNRFHWHLTDDQGWRLEIRRYPLLTSVGGWRNSPHEGPYGGFYTQAEVREVVAYAQARGITVVPEIDMPGHSQAAVAAYPRLGCTREKVETRSTWGVSAYILNAEPATLEFMKNVLREVLELFPSPWIHIGGDEAIKDQWVKSPEIQARIRQLGLKDEYELQSWFIGQMDEFLTARGRRPIGWDEILQGGLAPHATVMNWHEWERAFKAASSGHDAILAPSSHTYFDFYQSRDVLHEPLAMAGHTPLERVYGWEPLPVGLDKKIARHILGVQGQLWSEYLTGPEGVEYMAFPRLTALSEVAWSPSAGRQFGEFRARLALHLERLSGLDVHFRRLD